MSQWVLLFTCEKFNKNRNLHYLVLRLWKNLRFEPTKPALFLDEQHFISESY